MTDKPVWNCPMCGKLSSDRTWGDHDKCMQYMHTEEILELRAYVEGW